MWKTAKWSLAALVVALAIVLSGVVGHTIGDSGGSSSRSSSPGTTSSRSAGRDDFGVLTEIEKILREDFVNPDAIDPEALRKGAIEGIISALGDPHTVYIPPDQYKLG